MIYVSSSCVIGNRIDKVVEELIQHGITAIELSGGTLPFPGMIEQLEILQQKKRLDFLCHNYFPPPQKPFVFNLASTNEEIFQASLDHAKRNIATSLRLSADRVSFHAGFCLDFSAEQLGRGLAPTCLVDRDVVLERFCKGVRTVQKYTEGLAFYLENNVCSAVNKVAFKGENPFLLTNFQEYQELRKLIDFNLLLDVAHLKVSCQSHNLQFEKELELLLPEASYLHLSDNNGAEDANWGLTKGSNLFGLLKSANLEGKIITLEVYEGLDSVKNSLQLVLELME